MSSGHRTSAIERPRRPMPSSSGRSEGGGAAGRPRRSRRDRRDERGRERDRERDQTLFGDLTRPIQADRRLVTRRLNRVLLALGGVAVIGALLALLFVLPVQAWLRQEDDLADRRAELAVLERANAELEAEVLRLTTTEGAKEAARDELGLVDEGELRISILPSPGAPLTLPTGFHYDLITQVIAVRASSPVVAPPVADTVVP